MAALSFKTTEVPTIETGRVKTPNLYLPHAQAAVKARGEKNEAGEYPNAKAIVYTVLKEDVDRAGSEDKAVAYITRKVREAGNEVGVTVRLKDNEDGTVTLWAVDKITRAKKSE